MKEKVFEFLIQKLGVAYHDFNLNSKIESDFGLYGLDTFTFYEQFFKEFAIENLEDFEFDRYVSSENWDIGLIIKSLFLNSAREKLMVKEVSIGHLVRVAETRLWTPET